MKELLAVAISSLISIGAAEAPIQPLAAPAPTISLTADDEHLSITFTGILQAATSVTGPWADVPAASSPYFPESKSQQKYFRAVIPGVQSIFASTSIVDLTVTGPLQEHFEFAHAGMPDGIFPPLREKPWFNGKVKLGTMELPVSLRVRGNSSLQECPFPKLKMKVSSATRAGTPFEDAREIKIGTHCAEGGTGPVGRLRDETAAYREVLAYETMQILGFLAPRVRRAQIDYRDTTVAREGSETGWAVSRDALILDDAEVVAERLGGRALSDEEKEALRDANFDAQLITDLHVFHALLGNWDYTLSVDGRETWNADVIEMPNLQLVPMAGDFDLSSWVTGNVRRMAPPDYFPDMEELYREVRYSLESVFNQVGEERFVAAKARFDAKRSEIEAKIQASNMDETGRENAMRHVTAFFWALESFVRK